ncbi:hypothetical protein C4571_03380 [Candidatus Parcubacteria bacterium]|nr:MAG: hypothetical protein C4571_03380 [Candidatus Parcubacteria bacterium]
MPRPKTKRAPIFEARFPFHKKRGEKTSSPRMCKLEIPKRFLPATPPAIQRRDVGSPPLPNDREERKSLFFML